MTACASMTRKGHIMSWKEIVHENYTVQLEAPVIYVDNKSRGRSGHMTHAMAEFAPGCLIDFNANCSAVRCGGHSAFGFVEYRISHDSGKTYSEVYELPYSKDTLMDGVYTISVEKAVACDDGTIVAFCLRNTTLQEVCCEPWATPMWIRSTDGGMTWSQPQEYSPYPGRSYDAVYHDGVIYVLHWCYEHFIGEKEEHKYRIYRSADNGISFEELCVVPGDTIGRGYGAIQFDAQGRLHAYAYNVNEETALDHAVSDDCGKTWTVLAPCYLAKGIRNPQIGYIDGVYVLHGRAGGVKGFVLYTSEDATHWDEGCMVVDAPGISAFYSNNLNLRDEEGNFLLIQYSDPYEGWGKVNVSHLKLRVKR